MKLNWCCLLAALVPITFAAIDVEKTVKQVQSILQANQQLPRLTRDEILQLLNDIRSEDSKTSSSIETEEASSREQVPLQYNVILNEINPPLPNILNNIVTEDIDTSVETLNPLNEILTTTNHNKQTKNPTPSSSSEKNFSLKQLYPRLQNTSPTTNKPNLMVVLPYTPRDGSSLQELYTRPPRVEAVHVTSTPRPDTKSKQTTNYSTKLKDNVGLPTEIINNFPDELQAFLDAHGLTGKPGQDHFLLPLEGFKPLPPPAKVVDGTVQLPENILLTYDLIAPNGDSNMKNDNSHSANNFLYTPLKPELPFELDSSASDKKEVRLPYDLPAKTSKKLSSPNYEPIDYDSIKVIPLSTGINPLVDKVSSSNEQNKRQVSIEETTLEKDETPVSTTTTEAPKTNAISDSASADTETGASLSDLEASFGGGAPSQPGDSQLPPPKKNGFYWMFDWNSFLEVGDGDTKVNIRFEPKLGDPQMFLPVTVP